MSIDHYYTLGRSGLRVSRLALGTMTFGTERGWGADEAVSRAMFNRYLELGGNFFDTADGYTGGTSERLLGRFIKETGTRDGAVIATKFTFNGGSASGWPAASGGNPNSGGNHRKNIMRALEGSLRRLDTDYIDLYLMHSWDRITPVEEVMRTLDDAVRSGKVRYVGFSNVPAWYAGRAQTMAELRGWEPLSALQLEYSLVERNIEDEFTTLAQELGMGIMAWSPLASGLLSGKYRTGGSGRLDIVKDSTNPAFSKMTERNLALVVELEKVAAELGRSMAQVALNWVANRPGVGTVLVGATRIAQLDDNLAALDFAIPAELAERLDVVTRNESRYPYYFFEDVLQGMVHGGAAVGDKPRGYYESVMVSGIGS